MKITAVPVSSSSYDLPFLALADEIRKRAAGREIIYIPNPGNFGDGLIRYATKAFFRDNDIAHKGV